MMNLEECIDKIIDWYFSDTVELLDLILDDDIADPQYSAITTLNRLWLYLQYESMTNKNYECNDVSFLLKKIGYTSEDIILLRRKAQEEREIYTSDILDTKFFEE